MDPDPSHLCCSSAKTSSHYHKVYFHPTFFQAENSAPKDQGKGKFHLRKEKELNLHPYTRKKGRKKASKQLCYRAKYLPTYPWKEELSLFTFHRAEFGTNVIERRVIFHSPLFFFLLHEEEKEERESRIENRLRARDHSLSHYMDIAAVLPSASASVQEEGGERKRIAATPLPPKKKLPY